MTPQNSSGVGFDLDKNVRGRRGAADLGSVSICGMYRLSTDLESVSHVKESKGQKVRFTGPG